MFFADAAQPPQMPQAGLALLYNLLTPAETHVFELIVTGRTQSEIAAQLGSAPSTVKTHLLHLIRPQQT